MTTAATLRVSRRCGRERRHGDDRDDISGNSHERPLYDADEHNAIEQIRKYYGQFRCQLEHEILARIRISAALLCLHGDANLPRLP
jgi:hypothetical protein